MRNQEEALKISKELSNLYLAYESNMKELTKLLNEAAEYVKNEIGMAFWYDQAGPRSSGLAVQKLQPPKYALSVFYNNRIDNQEINEPNKTDWLLILLILLKEAGQKSPEEYISLNILHWNCLNEKGNRQMGNETEFQAVVSGKRKDWFDYSISNWSRNIVTAVRKDHGHVYQYISIPIGAFEGVDDFSKLLKPSISALKIKEENELKGVCFTPNAI